MAGRNGAAVVIAGVVIGFCVPWLSALARPYLAVAIFIFTFGSFLKFDGKSIGSEVVNMRRNLLMVVWATFGVPLIMIAIIGIARPGSELAQGFLFWSLVPASPACVAFAATLRLNVPIALVATVLGTAASPFYIPALAAFFWWISARYRPDRDAPQLVFLVGGAFLASMAAKRLASAFIREHPEAMTGIAVLAMFLAGMGSMRSMQCRHIFWRNPPPASSLWSWPMCCFSGAN